MTRITKVVHLAAGGRHHRGRSKQPDTGHREQRLKSRPDLFHAYVGIAQIVDYRENQAASYAKVVALARAAGDQRTVSTLEALGTPPWANPRNSGVLRRATREYEAKVSAPAPKSWWVPSLGYDSPQMRADYLEGEEFSYLQFVGLKGDGMFSKVDLPSLGMAEYKVMRQRVRPLAQ